MGEGCRNKALGYENIKREWFHVCYGSLLEGDVLLWVLRLLLFLVRVGPAVVIVQEIFYSKEAPWVGENLIPKCQKSKNRIQGLELHV